MAVIQGISTIFGGFLYAAVYLRSGSILVPIVMHALYDYMCFVIDPTLDNGIMTSEKGQHLSAVSDEFGAEYNYCLGGGNRFNDHGEDMEKERN